MKYSRSQPYTVGTTATKLADADSERGAVLVVNLTGTQIVYFGFDDGINTSISFPLPAIAGAGIRFTNKDEIWAITTPSTQTLHVFEDMSKDGAPALFLPAEAAASVQITDGVDSADVIDAGTYAGLAVVLLDAAGDPLYTVPISHAALTELAAAINANRVDVNLAADGLGLLTTTAHDAAFGTAGTADAQVRSIQGIASMTPVQVGDNSSSLTVDAPVGTPVFVRLSDGSAAIATLPVSLASLPATPAGTNAIGKLLPPDIDVTAHTNYIRKYYTSTGAVTDGIIWSPAAGKRWHVVSMYLQTSAAATITLEDDKSGGDDPVWKGEFAANQGMTIHWGELYPMASGEDAADLIITTSAGNIYCTVVGYEI